MCLAIILSYLNYTTYKHKIQTPQQYLHMTALTSNPYDTEPDCQEQTENVILVETPTYNF
jgi:hypothetical protein